MKSVYTGRQLKRMMLKLENPAPLLNQVGKILQANTVARILFTKKDPSGRAWPAWAASTLAARTRKGNASQGLLYDTGDLANSIQYRLQGKQVIVGTDLKYGKYLQEGTPNMPARPFIGISNPDHKEIMQAMVSFFSERNK